ncbi:hypothetical protein BCR44DRAFT_1083587 [Catenaria anguillulae PL171]|uniref:RING-type domain-containing protein n=1 Tax=Catenaria anguillulae PL171 TaxID=765915 RepID=A0A1Y2HNI3_9FUNG|nr:hypothetical protein BCR44DRAFT_1083587 [Catenaria anguillulae PL171]
MLGIMMGPGFNLMHGPIPMHLAPGAGAGAARAGGGGPMANFMTDEQFNRLSFEDLQRLTEEANNRAAAQAGLREPEMRKLVTRKFQPKADALVKLPEHSDPTCVVCQGDYEVNEELMALPQCGHVFHAECVRPWLKSHTTCPMCRNNVRDALAGLGLHVSGSASKSSSSSRRSRASSGNTRASRSSRSRGVPPVTSPSRPPTGRRAPPPLGMTRGAAAAASNGGGASSSGRPTRPTAAAAAGPRSRRPVDVIVVDD